MEIDKIRDPAGDSFKFVLRHIKDGLFEIRPYADISLAYAHDGELDTCFPTAGAVAIKVTPGQVDQIPACHWYINTDMTTSSSHSNPAWSYSGSLQLYQLNPGKHMSYTLSGCNSGGALTPNMGFIVFKYSDMVEMRTITDSSSLLSVFETMRIL